MHKSNWSFVGAFSLKTLSQINSSFDSLPNCYNFKNAKPVLLFFAIHIMYRFDNNFPSLVMNKLVSALSLRHFKAFLYHFLVNFLCQHLANNLCALKRTNSRVTTSQTSTRPTIALFWTNFESHSGETVNHTKGQFRWIFALRWRHLVSRGINM
jgi:hypothetical protein